MTTNATEPEAEARPKRLTLSEIVDKQLGALAKTQGEHCSVKLARNAKGDVQVEVSVRTGEHGIESVEDARRVAHEQFDLLCELYPMAQAGE